MRKTINERKALRYIYIGLSLNIIFFSLFGFASKDTRIIWMIITEFGWIISGMILCYNCYSLGWEYKRISMEEDA